MLESRKSLVYKGLPPNHACVDQALRILPGSWIVLFVTGGATEPDIANHIVLCCSTDEGETWSDAEEVLRYPDKACLLTEAIVDGDRVTVFVSTHDGQFDDWEVSTIDSRDGGRTWSAPAVFEPLPRRTFVRNLFVATSGRWVLPYQTYDTSDDTHGRPVFANPRNGTLISDDAGLSWTDSNRVGPVAGWAENNVTELSDGRLVMLIRSGEGFLYRSESEDAGHTWSAALPTEIPNPGSKFRLFRLSDGRILLLHNPNSATAHPNSKRQAACNRNPLALWISDDDMRSWKGKHTITDFPGMLAYPDGEIDEREEWVHFAFDYNRHDVIYWGVRLA